MSTLDVMTRLQLNFAEMSPTIARAFLFEPTGTIEQDDLPAIYPVQLGRMNNPIPREAAGSYVVERQYVYRALIAPVQASSTDSGNDGAYIDQQSTQVMDVPLDYFMVHPRLQTLQLPGLGVLTKDILITDSGVVVRIGPGGGQYRAIDYTITLAERRIPTIKLLS